MSLHESVATLTQLSDCDLWTSALCANGKRRRATALLLAHLAVIEARELHLLRGYSSMFDFCVRGLGMSEGTAHRAISGTRAAHRYPLVLEMLADGRLHLSGLSLLAPHLTAENHEKLLEEAAGKTKASIRAVLARWFPKPDVRDRVQPLSPKGEQGHLGLDGSPVGPRPRVEPLSEERFAVHFTASARLRDKLEHARNLMSHVSRELEVVIERALDALIRERENKQWGKTDRPRRSRGTKPGARGASDRLAPAKVRASRAGRCGAEAGKAPRRADGPGLQEDREQAGRGNGGPRRDLVHGRAAPPCVRVARSRMISAPPSTPRSKSAATKVWESPTTWGLHGSGFGPKLPS